MSDRIRIAAIGDSLTQGFMSGAISRTAISFPSMIAQSMRLQIPDDFRVPRFPGSGLPLNLEECLHYIDDRLGPDIQGTYNWVVRFPQLFGDFVDSVEDLYERGSGSRPQSSAGVFHNLAVWGFRVHDSFSVTPKVCRKAIRKDEGIIQDDFLGIPSGAMYRTAMRVLNPTRSSSRDGVTQVLALKSLVDTEGLDALILYLGANDCLGTVLSLKVDDMDDFDGSIPRSPIKRRRWNLTSARQFRKDYRFLADQLKEVLPPTTKVFVGTVPHVTIPPVTRGIKPFHDRYFEYYSRFFLTDETFNHESHSHLTRHEAIQIDHRIDSFNNEIKAIASDNDWNLVDVCGTLDMLAVRRNESDNDPQQPLIDYFESLNLPRHPLLRLEPIPSILMMQSSEFGQRQGGGLFSLDGVHPTTIGYGIIADLFLRSMKNAGVEGADPDNLDWGQLVSQDSLVRRAPRVWDDIVGAATSYPWIWDNIFKRMG